MNRAKNWVEGLVHCQDSAEPYVIVTVLPCAGSTPRDAGAKMIVTDANAFDTIGGGHLEFETIKMARNYLLQGKTAQHLEHFGLSSKLGQCCGGAMNILFEVQAGHSQRLWLFGAGHVAKALVPVIANLPLQIHWIDSRDDQFPDQSHSCVTQLVEEEPQALIKQCRAGDWVLVMTHQHPLDYAIVEAALQRGDLPYVGMIGSQTKARRFRQRLQRRDITQGQLSALVSPVGDLSIPGKQPIEVAISIAAQLVKLSHANDDNTPANTKTQWRQAKELSKWL